MFLQVGERGKDFQIHLNHYSQIWHVFTIGMSREGAKITSSNLLSSPRKGGLVWSHPTWIPSSSENSPPCICLHQHQLLSIDLLLFKVFFQVKRWKTSNKSNNGSFLVFFFYDELLAFFRSGFSPQGLQICLPLCPFVVWQTFAFSVLLKLNSYDPVSFCGIFLALSWWGHCQNAAFRISGGHLVSSASFLLHFLLLFLLWCLFFHLLSCAHLSHCSH